MTHKWRRRTDPVGEALAEDGEALAEECVAFLAGGYVESCEGGQNPVPVWAWMNVLAHGTEAELRAAALDRPHDDPGHQARAFVAGELIDLIDAGCLDLETFQREVLVPLELDVMACPASSLWRPAELVSGLLGAVPTKPRGAHRSAVA